MSKYQFKLPDIGEGIADELLSVGKHTGSLYVSNYLDLINEYVK